jgi:2-methylcitrate dehydratase PrpD
MQSEAMLAEFVQRTQYDDLPEEALLVMKRVVLTTLGTAIAGANEDGCREARELALGWGGHSEATVLFHGTKLPAPQAALVNGVMCRALDFCDAMAPGVHIGSSLVPAALAAAELRGGCDGREFLVALAVGAELASRMNLTEQAYNGFDPTGVAAIFASTAVTARLLGLSPLQTHHALALAFNRAGGSFQSNIDGSLAVRFIQGWVAEMGVVCALLAQKGVTGPLNFITGVYGYANLFARGGVEPQAFTLGLGQDYFLTRMMFKKYPSCGLSQGATELAIRAAETLDLARQNVASVEVTLPPYAFRLVGHQFEIGENPRVNAQFSVKYCVANAILNRSSRLKHFRRETVRLPEMNELVSKVSVVSDPTIEAHTAVGLRLVTKKKPRFRRVVGYSSRFPGESAA